MSAPRPVVLVTGGAGFIGSHVCDRLATRGCVVIVVDDLRTGRRANLARWLDAPEPRVHLVQRDVAAGLEEPLAELAARLGPPRRVIHLAAQVSVAVSLADPLGDLHVNYRGTLAALEYARAVGADKFVLASSAAVYGDGAVPAREAQPPDPISPYGVHKLASEHAVRCYAAAHGLPGASLRFFNVYGPRQDPRSPYSGVISVFAARARAGEPLTVLGDGGQTRDFVYVGDVARAVVDAALADGGDGAPCNVATGRETTVLELARAVTAACGSDAPVGFGPARAGDIRRSVAEVERAAEVLGFRAEVALADGLRATVEAMGG